MKYIISYIAAMTVSVLVIPLAICTLRMSDSGGKEDFGGENVRVLMADTGKVVTQTMDEYLVGVVAAEMPAAFDTQALMAQAVAARTYALQKMKSSSSPTHSNADVCTDFRHCQAYITEEKAKTNWGKNASENYKKCKNAVVQTSGEIMVYDGEPIKAVFHSSSSGQTENASDVWGSDVPYLTSVKSPGEQLCPSHKSEVTVSEDEFKSALSKKYNVDFSGSFIGKTERSKSGLVKTIAVGDKTIKGTQMRELFGLRSANFKIERTGGNIVFKVSGNGHGVGMSQYGAQYLATHGYDYKRILKKYYSGAQLEKIY